MKFCRWLIESEKHSREEFKSKSFIEARDLTQALTYRSMLV